MKEICERRDMKCLHMEENRRKHAIGRQSDTILFYRKIQKFESCTVKEEFSTTANLINFL